MIPPPQPGFPAASHPPWCRRPATPPAIAHRLPHRRHPVYGYPNPGQNLPRLELTITL